MLKERKSFDRTIYIPAKCFHAGICYATSAYNMWQNWNRIVYKCTLSFHVLSVHAGLILTSFSILSISDHIGHTSLFCPGVLFACDSLRFLSFFASRLHLSQEYFFFRWARSICLFIWAFRENNRSHIWQLCIFFLLNRTVLAWNANLKNDILSLQSFHRTKNSYKSYADQLKAALKIIYVKGNS